MKNVRITRILGFFVKNRLLPFLVLILSLNFPAAITLDTQSPFLIFIERGSSIIPLQSLIEDDLVNNGVWKIKNYTPEKSLAILNQTNRSKIELVLFLKPAQSSPPALVSGPDLARGFLGDADLNFSRKLRAELLQSLNLDTKQSSDLGFIPYREIKHLSNPYLVIHVSAQEDMGRFSKLLCRFLADTFPNRFILKEDMDSSEPSSPFAVPIQTLAIIPGMQQEPISSEKDPLEEPIKAALRPPPSPTQPLMTTQKPPMAAPGYLVEASTPQPRAKKKTSPQFFDFLITTPSSKAAKPRSIGFGGSNESLRAISSVPLTIASTQLLGQPSERVSTTVIPPAKLHQGPLDSMPSPTPQASTTIKSPLPRSPSSLITPSIPVSTQTSASPDLLSELNESGPQEPDPVPFWAEE